MVKLRRAAGRPGRAARDGPDTFLPEWRDRLSHQWRKGAPKGRPFDHPVRVPDQLVIVIIR